MAIRSVLLAIAVGMAAAASGGSASRAEGWPRLNGDAAKPQCEQAYRLGMTAFRSANADLSWPIAPPAKLGSAFVLHRTKIDISGGDGLEADDRVFAITKSASGQSRVLAALLATGGKRLAVLEEPVGWRGDLYSAFLLDLSAPADALLPPVSEGRGLYGGGRLKPFVDETWAPPLVLKDQASDALWVIEFDGFQYLGDWRIYTFDQGTARLSCSLAFHPPMRTDLSLLPEAVRGWAASLDEALGPGKDEGTLQSTARMRIKVRNAWSNASLRPWALMAPAYNTAQEVEDGLAQWASGSAARTRLLTILHTGRPLAELRLAAYYKARFALTPGQAREASAYVLDYMLRGHFIFHVEGGRLEPPATQNPWPSGVR